MYLHARARPSLTNAPAGICQLCEVAKRLGAPPPVSTQNDFSMAST